MQTFKLPQSFLTLFNGIDTTAPDGNTYWARSTEPNFPGYRLRYDTNLAQTILQGFPSTNPEVNGYNGNFMSVSTRTDWNANFRRQCVAVPKVFSNGAQTTTANWYAEFGWKFSENASSVVRGMVLASFSSAPTQNNPISYSNNGIHVAVYWGTNGTNHYIIDQNASENDTQNGGTIRKRSVTAASLNNFYIVRLP